METAACTTSIHPPATISYTQKAGDPREDELVVHAPMSTECHRSLSSDLETRFPKQRTLVNRGTALARRPFIRRRTYRILCLPKNRDRAKANRIEEKKGEQLNQYDA